jgi:pectate lyase/pectin methylesterase-like acyl-CoA thioesterase
MRKEEVMSEATGLLKNAYRHLESRQGLALVRNALISLFVLVAASSSASAAITFDASSSSTANQNVQSVTWKHTIGGGLDRALVVGVSIDDFILFDGDIASVTFNGVPMHAAPNSHAQSLGLLVLETQIFYLTSSELPSPGTYDVVVNLTRKVVLTAGGAVSLFGVQQGAPVAAATKTKLLGLGPISTTVNAPANSWLVDIVTSESDLPLTPSAGQTKRFSASRTLFGIAGSTEAAAPSGPTTLSWDQKGLSRMVTSAVALAAAPVFTLSTATIGLGVIQTNPAGSTFIAGTPVTLTAVPAAGWQFGGWTGDLTGAANPATITMDANKSVTATFVQVPPAITTQPLSQTVTAGSSVTFNVAATGTPPLGYQWKKDGTDIAGASAASLSLANVQAADAGAYAVSVSNAVGSVLSNPATLTVTPAPAAPVITTQPASRTATVGDNVSFSVAATGFPAPAYQWKKNGADLAGATSPTFSLTNVQLSDAGTFTVVVSNSQGSVTSDPAVLTVNPPPSAPVITTQPLSQTATVGDNVTFTVAATGFPAPTYQWQKNGTAIQGANAATLTLTNVQLTDAGTFTVAVSNSQGSVTSNPATLQVNPPVSAPVITTQPQSLTANVGDNVSFTVAATAFPAPAYQWNKNGAPVTGATAPTLSLSNVQLTDAGVYGVTVSNSAGTVQSSLATLGVASPTGLTLINDSFADGERATFTPPGSTTWLKAQSSTAVAMAPGSAQFTWNTTSADMISAFFTAPGSPVTLGVGDSLTVSLTFSFTGLNPGSIAAPSPGLRFGILDSKGSRPADNGGTGNAAYVGDTGYGLFTSISTAGSGTAFTLNRRTTLSSNNIFNTGADFTTIGSGGGTALSFANNTDYVLTYSITRLSATQTTLATSITGGALGTAYNFSTTETSATPATTFDYFGWRVSSSNFAASITFKNLTVTLGLVPPAITTQPVGAATVEGTTVVLTAAATGSAPLTFQWSKNGAPIAGATDTTLTLSNVHVNDSGNYTFTSTNPAGSVTSNVATVVVALAPPVITTQPQSQTVSIGDPVAFTLAVTGSAPFTYQWQKNGAPITGATGPSFSIAAAQLSDAGAYTIVVTNGAGSATSAAATLTVTTAPVPPTITTQPASTSVVVGNPVQFSVVASGTSPLNYQWSKDGAVINSATSPTLAITSAATTDAGSYTVAVTNAAGSVTSSAAVLTVIMPPSITTPHAPQTVSAGTPATFSVTAAGTAPLGYQWLKNGSNIPGATSATLTLNSVQAGDAGSYAVVVSNAGGSVTSPAATLTVVDPALAVSSLFPANAAAGVPIDTPLKITFGVAPTLGTSGVIQIKDATTSAVVDTIDLAAGTQTRTIGGTVYNYLPVIISGNVALIVPHVSLAYNGSYFVTVDPGVFQTASGVFAGIAGNTAWRFSTKPTAPPAGSTALTVAADGTGDFATVQGAIDFVPTANTTRTLIVVRKGLYQELVHINNKPLVTLHGEDRTGTVIAYANNSNFNPSARSVVGVDTADITIENLTVRNLTPKGGSQAEAIRTNGLRFLLRKCDLYSFQDTLQLNGSAYVDSCYIEGDVDFMWGTASAYFVNCEAKMVTSAGYYVQSRTPQGQPGFVYVNCRLSGASGVAGGWLARIDPTVFPDSQVIYINSAMGPQVQPAGWLLNNATNSSTVRFWEYHSIDFTGAAIDVSQRIASSRQLSDAEATQWSDPQFVLGGWVPQALPIIQSQPVSQTVSAGQDVLLAVGAFGLPAPTYQWIKDGAAIAGATGPTLLLPAVQAGAAGYYTVAVSNSVGSVTSSAASLTIASGAGAPAIVTPPASQTATIGSGASFSVTATGTPALAYQWLKDGAPIAAATSSTLSLNAVLLSNAGYYSVTVTNAVGSVTSAPVLLTVRATPATAAPVITTQPASQIAFVGDTVVFSVAAQAVPPPSYQWMKDGTAITGANASTLTVTNVQLTSAGSYTVVITNSAGSITSSAATLTVFAPASLITQQPQSQVVNIGDTASFTVTASAAGPISYQWRKNGTDIPGATAPTLTLPGVQPTDTGVYSVFVTSGTQAALSSPAILTVTSPATQLPPLRTFNMEGFATLGHGTTGGGGIDPSDTTHYKVIDASTPNPAQALQTYLQSSDPMVVEVRTDIDLGPLNNHSNPPLINPELIASGIGSIRVASNKTVFSDRGSTLTHGSLNIDGSQNIIIRNLRFRRLWEWDDATQGNYDLQNWDFITLTNGAHNIWIDHCDIGKVYDGQTDIIRGSDLVTVSYCRYNGDLDNEVVTQINYLESLYQANPADSRISYYASLRNGGQTVSQIVTHEIPQDKTSLVGNDDNLGAIDGGKLNVTYHHDTFTLIRQRTPRMRFGNAHVYNIFVDDTQSAAAPGTQTAVNSTINAAVLVENSDFLEVRTPLMFSGGGRITQRGSIWQLNGAPAVFPPTSLNPVDPSTLVWNPPASFTWTDLTTLPYAYTLDPATFNSDNPDKIGTIVPTSATDQALLRGYLPLTAQATAASSFTLQLSTQGSGTIQSNPAGATPPAGTSVQLTALPSAGWQFSNWTGSLSGNANPATIVMDGPKTITAVFVQVITPPSITTQPVSQTASVGGGTVTFSVVATGTAPLTYQWNKDGSDISGATNATLTLTSVQASDAGSYLVRVSNGGGTVTSNPATLTVTAAPTVALRERFADGDRSTQGLPDSAAWFTSSGTSNFTAVPGQATQTVSSSRTLLAYFTNAAATPVTVGANQQLTLDFTVQFTGFDTAAAAGANTFVVGLLRSVANPAATSGTGFVADGPPNTSARVSGDFGSSNPTSNVFTNYGGYAAMTSAGLPSTATPIRFYARTGTSASLLNTTTPFTQITGAAATASSPMATGTDYEGTLTLQNTGSGIALSFTFKDATTGNIVMSYAVVDAAGAFTQFDTVGFYVSKATASASYSFIIKTVDVSISGGTP